MIYSASEMSRNIYTAAKLALQSRASAGTRQTAPSHWDKSKTSGKGWLGITGIQEHQSSSSGADAPMATGKARQPLLLISAEQPRLEASFPKD